MTQEQATKIRESIRELATNSYRLGMAQGSGAEVFAGGEAYSFTFLLDQHKGIAQALDDLVDGATR